MNDSAPYLEKQFTNCQYLFLNFQRSSLKSLNRFYFLQPTTTHRIYLNCCPRVPRMFLWNIPY